jgi:MFS family permease
MYLTGCGLLMAFTIGCGLAKTGIQLIVFRAMSGIAMSFCLPSAVSIITTTFSTGQRRNIAFACLGASQPAGFSLGLVLGGVLVGSIGWRVGYYIVAGANVLITATAIWGLPSDPRKVAPITWRRLQLEIDWVGALLASTSLGLLSYVFA